MTRWLKFNAVGRWLKFNIVGMFGALVQLSILALLVRLGVHYLVATALAVETAVLQNYYWHARWTWKGRDGSLWRFHLANGLISVLSNLIWMRIFTGWLVVPLIPANLMAITLTSLANFV